MGVRPGIRTPLAWLLAATIILTASAATAAGRKGGKKYAVVVGINQYQRQDITPLKCAVSDAHLLAAALRALNYKVYEMTSDADREGDLYPSSNNIGFQLGNIRRIMDEDGSSDNTFVFF